MCIPVIAYVQTVAHVKAGDLMCRLLMPDIFPQGPLKKFLSRRLTESLSHMHKQSLLFSPAHTYSWLICLSQWNSYQNPICNLNILWCKQMKCHAFCWTFPSLESFYLEGNEEKWAPRVLAGVLEALLVRMTLTLDLFFCVFTFVISLLFGVTIVRRGSRSC